MPGKISPLITLYIETETTGKIILPFKILKQGLLAFNILYLHFYICKVYYYKFIIPKRKYDRIREISYTIWLKFRTFNIY